MEVINVSIRDKENLSFNTMMEKALENFNFEEDYTTSSIIKYSVMVTRLPIDIKKHASIHSNYNKNFFKDLKKSRFFRKMFLKFPPSYWLENSFRLIKYELKDFFENDEHDNKFKLFLEFCELDETKKTVNFK
jgi:hypothetical protein